MLRTPPFLVIFMGGSAPPLLIFIQGVPGTPIFYRDSKGGAPYPLFFATYKGGCFAFPLSLFLGPSDFLALNIPIHPESYCPYRNLLVPIITPS